MPLLSPPSVVPLPNGQYAVRFTYQWGASTGIVADPITSVNVGGIIQLGSEWFLNLLAVQSGANLPPFKTLQISQTFQSVDGTPDGELDIYIPSSGQTVRIGANPVTSNAWSVVNANIPIITATPAQILFGKGCQTDGGNVMYGKLIGTLFTMQLPSTVIYGQVTGQ